jgi:hypothetical protein
LGQNGLYGLWLPASGARWFRGPCRAPRKPHTSRILSHRMASWDPPRLTPLSASTQGSLVSQAPTLRDNFFCFKKKIVGCCYSAKQLDLQAAQVQQERTQVVCSNREARECPTRGYSRNGPWTWRHTHTHVDKYKRNRTKDTSTDTQHKWTTPTRNSN